MNEKGISTKIVAVFVVILAVIVGGAAAYLMTQDGNGEQTTIHVAAFAGPETEILEKNLYTPFEEETGINVEVHIWDEETMREKQIMDFRSGNGKYDVIKTQLWHVPRYLQNDWLYPMDEFVEESDIDLNNYPGLDGYRHDGHLYGIPETVLTSQMIYRKDIFENQGWEVPENMSEYMDVLEKFQDLQEQGEYTNMSGTWIRGTKDFPSYGGLGGLVWAYGGEFLTEDFHSNVYNQKNLEAVRQWVRLGKEFGPGDQANLDWVKGGELYGQGNILMFTDVSGHINYVEADDSSVQGKNGFSTAPIYESTGRHLQWSTSSGLAINADSTNKEAAWKFIRWRQSEEAYRIEIENKIRLDMPFKPAYDWDIHQDLAQEWGVQPAMESLQKAQEYATFEYWPQIPEFTEVGDSICANVSKAIAGDQTVEQALKNADEEVEEILREAGYYD